MNAAALPPNPPSPPNPPGGNASNKPRPLTAWDDRWTEPDLEQLLEPIEEVRRKHASTIIEAIEAFEGVESSLVWHGLAWKWTLQFDMTVADGSSAVLAFVVPKPEAPVLCIPLRRDLIEKLPLRRLTKYIRDGIKVAKYASDTHWGMWTPGQNPEVEQLMDLVKRKHKILRTGAAEQGD